ncbi:MAG: DUF3656 domain-containing protein [Clostridia bacterium]|nr:DUF3656 domain-containing protein [Clostridia bacterium]
MVELLSPVGDFECLKAAVQNGADCVYFGATSFSARASASNFNLENLSQAIEYAKLRGVRTNLTLNTLIKDEEFEDAYNLAKKAYEFGIDAIIVQDLGLGLKLIKDFPDLAIHASTQMSVHNLQGVLKLQELGFKRVVLARELSAQEIEYICKNSNVEIECFIHGALCICYSGQCLFSSMIGGRSGNRGKCAQPCRLPYTLIDKEGSKIDNGYIISPKDLCGLEFIPFLIDAGVTSFKIEGRMKTPEYVAIVTKIYRKYIDLALSGNNFVIDDNDKKDLLQVFNRGLSSTGHLEKDANTNLIYKDKPNNMGLPLGIVQNYNKNKGYITLKLKESIKVGDTISLENENGTYTISELMKDNSKKLENIDIGKNGQTIVIGRMKGNIKLGDKVFKMSSRELNLSALESIKQENRKIPLTAKVTIKKDSPISIRVKSSTDINLYKDLDLTFYLNESPVDAKNKPLDNATVIEKINKTGNTIFEFSKITVELDKNVFIPKLSLLNELRRNILEMVQDYALKKISRKASNNSISIPKVTIAQKTNPKISVLLNILSINLDYSKLENIDNLYIPLKYFSSKKYCKILELLSNKFDLYIYLPTIIKANYRNIFYNNIEKAIASYKIKGLVLSNISNFVLIKDLVDKYTSLELIANYTFNIYNNFTIKELKNLGISKYNVSPELDKSSILSLGNICKKELIVYGKIPVINTNYCLLGKTNKCYPKCDAKCSNADDVYYLKDRLNMSFEILPDNIQTVTTIYNSKTFSVLPNDFNLDFARIDILHEDIDKINEIISKVKNNERFEGKEFTNGNLNREI